MVNRLVACAGLGLLTVFWFSFSAGAAAKDATQEALRGAVGGSIEKLGKIPAWQKKIVDEEVMPYYRRFIRNYRATANGVNVEVDEEGLRKYLSFHASNVFKSPPPPKALLIVRTDPKCQRCTASAAELTKILKGRVERRGLLPLVPTEEDIDPQLAGVKLEERALALAKQKRLAGAFIFQTSAITPDDPDDPHADELRFLVRSLAFLQPGTDIRKDGQLEILENDSVEEAAVRLLTDAWTELGDKIAAAKIGAEAAAGAEIPITINGLKEYAQYQRVKAKLQSVLLDYGVPEDRKFSRGKVVFVVKTARPAAEVKAKLTGLTLDLGRLAPVNIEGDETSIQLEWRP